ncbi:leucine-rich repeat domain-containing protein [Listeria ivanovii subsp. londoniensis]|nr:leucine-rich repeat domain-containing protein [Listeria ivanovii subsp. londoniensis]
MKKKDCLKNWLIVCLTVIMVICINTSLETKVHAANLTSPKPINQVFTDPNLAEVVKKSLGKQSVSDFVSQRELESVTKLLAYNRNINSLEGLQYFTNLKQLYLPRNQINDLSPLKNLTKLDVLDVNGNGLKSLNGIPSMALVSLYAGKNELTDVDALFRLRNLESLFIGENKIRNIDGIAHLTNLKELDLSVNEIRDLSALRNLKKLTYVDLALQKYVNKPMKFQPELSITKTVKRPDGALISPNYISNNGIYRDGCVIWQLPTYTKEVTFTFSENVSIGETTTRYDGVVIQPFYSKMPIIDKPTAINKIFLDSNLAEVLKRALRKKLVTDVVSQNELDKLYELHADNRDITSIEGLQYLSNLRKLFLSDNHISDINSLEESTHLTELYLDNNDLTDRSVNALIKIKQLESLSIRGNKVSGAIARNILINLTKLHDFNWCGK